MESHAVNLPTFVYRWPAYWQERLQERAAIMEFQGNMTREQADREAEKDIRRQAEAAPAAQEKLTLSKEKENEESASQATPERV
jgi:hypothetical protein